MSALLHSAYPSLGSVHLLTHTFFLSSHPLPQVSAFLMQCLLVFPSKLGGADSAEKANLSTTLRINGIAVLESREETLGERPIKFLLAQVGTC